MGFFKKIFKKKKGGTFFGNLLRRGASMATGGILGSGMQLAKQDAKFEEREQQEMLRQQQKAFASMSKKAPMGSSGNTVSQKFNLKNFINDNWKILLPVTIAVVGGGVYLSKNKNSNSAKGRKKSY